MTTQTFLLPDDLKALERFFECVNDFDAEGHDVPKDAMRRLAEIGVVRHLGFGTYQVTSFGDYVLGIVGGADFELPLKTLQEYNAESKQRSEA